jgi:hypothetical protein
VRHRAFDPPIGFIGGSMRGKHHRAPAPRDWGLGLREP